MLIKIELDLLVDIFCFIRVDKLMNNLVLHFQILDLKRKIFMNSQLKIIC